MVVRIASVVRNLALAGVMIAWASPLLAADKPADKPSADLQGFTPSLTKADWLTGHKVVNGQNERIGYVHDLVLASDLQSVSYVVLSTGSVIGIGGKLHALPWDALAVNPDAKTVTLAVDAKTLEESPSFDSRHWPDLGSSQSAERDYWREHGPMPNEPAKAAAGKSAEMAMNKGLDTAAVSEQERSQMAAGGQYFKYRRATELIGLSVKNRQDKGLGDIEDLVIDTHEGKVVFAYITFGGLLGVHEKIAPIPWSAIEIRPRLSVALLDADKDTLEAIAFESGKEPNLTDTDTAGRLYARFHESPYWEVYGYVGPEEKGAAKLSTEAWAAGSTYNAHFDPKTLVDFAGTIESVGSFYPADNAPAGIRLKIKTDKGETVTVQVGPRSYAADKGIGFAYGDNVTVSASRTTVNDKTIMMATKIQKGNLTLELRNESGQPKWDASSLK